MKTPPTNDSDNQPDSVAHQPSGALSRLDGVGVGRPARDFVLEDHTGTKVRLLEVCRQAPVLVVFYPSDFTVVCTKQLCNYRDHYESFDKLGVQILGVSPNNTESHAKFVRRFGFPFRLLADPGQNVARAYGCISLWMLGNVSRAVFIINTHGIVLYRHVEPTVLTHRTAAELLKVFYDLRERSLV